MNEEVKVDQEKLKKAKTFSARIKKLTSNLNFWKAASAALVIAEIVSIGKFVKDVKDHQKKLYGTCKRSELKKLANDLDDNLKHVDDMVDDMEKSWQRLNPNATEDQKKDFAVRKAKEKKRLTEELKKDKKVLKDNSSVPRVVIAGFRDLIKELGNVISWVIIQITGNGTETGEGYKVTHKRGHIDKLEAFDKYGDKKPVDKETVNRAVKDGALKPKKIQKTKAEEDAILI